MSQWFDLLFCLRVVPRLRDGPFCSGLLPSQFQNDFLVWRLILRTAMGLHGIPVRDHSQQRDARKRTSPYLQSMRQSCTPYCNASRMLPLHTVCMYVPTDHLRLFAGVL